MTLKEFCKCHLMRRLQSVPACRSRTRSVSECPIQRAECHAHNQAIRRFERDTRLRFAFLKTSSPNRWDDAPCLVQTARVLRLCFAVSRSPILFLGLWALWLGLPTHQRFEAQLDRNLQVGEFQLARQAAGHLSFLLNCVPLVFFGVCLGRERPWSTRYHEKDNQGRRPEEPACASQCAQVIFWSHDALREGQTQEVQRMPFPSLETQPAGRQSDFSIFIFRCKPCLLFLHPLRFPKLPKRAMSA